MKTTVSLFLLLGAVLLSRVPAATPERPNILLIVADDLGWADVGWHGGKFPTPNLDRLVKEGAELDRHYVQPVCTPTRVALLSGRWTSRFGPHALAPTNLRAFPAGTVTLASALKESGYATYISGKWHLGSLSEWGPQHYGFDQSYGSLAGAVDPWAHTYRKGRYLKTWHRNGELLEEEGNATELVSKQACAWIREAAANGSPWFLYVPFQAVHNPIDAPEEYKRLYDHVTFPGDEARTDAFRRYGAFVSQLDAKIGEMIAALDETKQRGRTLVVFTSDNGGTSNLGNPYAGNTPPMKAVIPSNLPLRGQKGQLHEGGVRVTAFANWPGVLEPRKVSDPIHAADWMPTIIALTGGKVDAAKFDGRDIWPLLTGREEKPAPRSIYIPHPSGATVLHGDWKLISYKGKKPAELYRITSDPYEKANMAEQEPARLAELQGILANLRRDDVTELPADLRNLPDIEGK